MKRLLLTIILLFPAAGLPADYFLFMKDGSRMKCARPPAFLYGKAVATLESGKTVTFDHEMVDIKRTRDYNSGKTAGPTGSFTFLETTGTEQTDLTEEEWLRKVTEEKKRPKNQEKRRYLENRKKKLQERLQDIEETLANMDTVVPPPGPSDIPSHDLRRKVLYIIRLNEEKERLEEEKSTVESELEKIDEELNRLSRE